MYIYNMRLLLIEDEHKIAQALKSGLEMERYAVDVCYNGEDGLNTALNDEYDLILLDVMLPVLDGIEVCKQLRKANNHTPILMLTAKDQDRDIIAGLDNGADDYLAKPFSFEVLLARINALLRRPHDKLEEILTAGDLSLDARNKIVKRGNKEIHLSAKEFSILEYMLRNKGKIITKQNIISHVWDFDADVLPNNVEVFITYLRNKIDKPFKQKPLITTVRGFGYKVG